jgi:hypothetical protein
VLPLEGQHVLHAEAVDGIARRRAGHIDDDSRRDQLVERHGPARAPALGEVDGGVEVRPAMLGRAECVRGVEPAAGRRPEGQALEPERRGRRRPIERPLVEGVREIDDTVSARVEGLRTRSGAEPHEDQREQADCSQ